MRTGSSRAAPPAAQIRGGQKPRGGCQDHRGDHAAGERGALADRKQRRRPDAQPGDEHDGERQPAGGRGRQRRAEDAVRSRVLGREPDQRVIQPRAENMASRPPAEMTAAVKPTSCGGYSRAAVVQNRKLKVALATFAAIRKSESRYGGEGQRSAASARPRARKTAVGSIFVDWLNSGHAPSGAGLAQEPASRLLR